MANELRSRFDLTAMRAKLTVMSVAYSLNFEEVVGFVARDRMLNDAVLHFARQAICDSVGEAKLRSSLVFVAGPPPSPASRISETECAAFPVHVGTLHWGVIIAVLLYPSQVVVLCYEPLCRTSYRPVTQHMWWCKLEPILRKWHTDCGESE